MHRRVQTEFAIQLDAQAHSYQGRVTSSRVQQVAIRAAEATDERKVDELSFSLKFTREVLQMDKGFSNIVKDTIRHKKSLVGDIWKSRKNQLSTLDSLIDLLDGKYTVPALTLSLLQLGGPGLFSTLQATAESAIQNKQNTHSILMRVKDMLDNSVPVDANSVQSVVKEMNGVVHSLENDQTRADEARRRCASQFFQAGQEERQLKADEALMSTDKTHTDEAIAAAKSNLEGIVLKKKALTRSVRDFAHISVEALKTMSSQSKDRKTIMMAVERAMEVEQASNKGPVLPLLRELLEDLRMQDAQNTRTAKCSKVLHSNSSATYKDICNCSAKESIIMKGLFQL